MSHPSAKVLLVSLSGVDWASLNARIADGRMPAIAAIIADGAFGCLRSPYPPESIATAATLATGRSAVDHGIVLGQEPWAGGMRPLGRDAWGVAPLWWHAAEAGLATLSIGLPAMQPGAAWPGCHVDARLAVADAGRWEDWPLPRDLSPPQVREQLRDLRVHPSDLSGAEVRPLLRDGATIDPRDHRMVDLAAAIARLATIDAASHVLLEEQPWDVAIVHHDWLSVIAERFATAAAPFDVTLDRAWTLLDATIGELRRRCSGDTTMLIASAGRGVRAGALIASGPGVAAGSRMAGLSVFDLVPSVLALFGLRDPALPGVAHLTGPTPRIRNIVWQPAQRAADDPADLARVRAFGLSPPPQPPHWDAQRLAAIAQIVLPSDGAAAERLAAAALAAGPDMLAPLGILAATRIGREDTRELPGLADRTAALPGGEPWAKLVRAAAFALDGDGARAATELKALAADPNCDPDVLARAATVWLMIGDATAALALTERVLASQPERIDALLIGAAAARGSTRAVGLLRRVLALDPLHPLATQALAAQLNETHRRDRP